MMKLLKSNIRWYQKIINFNTFYLAGKFELFDEIIAENPTVSYAIWQYHDLMGILVLFPKNKNDFFVTERFMGRAEEYNIGAYSYFVDVILVGIFKLFRIK